MAERDNKVIRIINNIKRLVPGSSTSQPQDSDQPLFRNPSDTFVPTYDYSTFMDVAALDREDSVAAEKLDQLRAESQKTQLLFRKPAELKRWTDLERRFHAIYGEMQALNTGLRPEDNSITVRDLFTNHVLQTGGAVINHRVIDQQVAFVNKYIASPTDTMTPYFDFVRNIAFGDVMIKFGDLSIMDLARNRNLPLSQVLDFFMRGVVTRTMIGHNQIFAENSDVRQPYNTQFPNIIKNQIDRAAAKIYGLAVTNSATLTDSTRGVSGERREILDSAKNLVTYSGNYLKRILDSYLNPDSRDHQSIIQVLEKYLAGGKRSQLLTINILSSADAYIIKNLFRTSKDLASSSKLSTYSRVAEVIYEYMQHTPQGGYITAEELDFIFVDRGFNQQATTEEHAYAQLAFSSREIAQNTSLREFGITPDALEWDGIIPAQAVKSRMDQNNPTRFEVEFEYNNDQGELLGLSLFFDTKRDRHDWSVLEDISDSELTRYRFAALTRISAQVLQSALGQAKEIAQARNMLKTDTSTALPPVKKPKRERPPHDHDKPTREKTPAVSKILTPIEQALQEGFSEAVRTETKFVVIPSGQQLAAVSQRLSTKDRDIILTKLQEQNSRGVGRFKRLRQPGAEGRPRYSYRVGDTRIILKEVDAEQGTRRFEIENIDYRQNVYG